MHQDLCHSSVLGIVQTNESFIALAFLELAVFPFCQHLWIFWLKENSALQVVIGGCIMVCKVWCETVETLLMERAVHSLTDLQRGFLSTERIILRRSCSLTTELYTEQLCFSSNVRHFLLKLTPHSMSQFLVMSFI